jgi:hypothetical protein
MRDHWATRRPATLRERLSRHRSRQDLAAAAIGDFVNWACALDERLDNTDATYAARRDADDDGRVLPALRFVRDRQKQRMARSLKGGSCLVDWSIDIRDHIPLDGS